MLATSRSCAETLCVFSHGLCPQSSEACLPDKELGPSRDCEWPVFCPKASDRAGIRAWMSPYLKPIFSHPVIAQRSLERCSPIWPHMTSLNSSNKASHRYIYSFFLINDFKITFFLWKLREGKERLEYQNVFGIFILCFFNIVLTQTRAKTLKHLVMKMKHWAVISHSNSWMCLICAEPAVPVRPLVDY